MSILKGTTNKNAMYQGNVALHAVMQGSTRIWPGSLITEAPRADGSFAMNAIRLNPDGTTSYRSAYAGDGVGYSLNLGNWRRTGLTLVAPNDTFQAKIDLFLNEGDYVDAQSDELNFWYNLNPANSSLEYVAENDQGINRAIFRVSIKDGGGRREVWYADCYTNTSGRFSKTPIALSGTFSYPAYGGSVSATYNTFFDAAVAGFRLVNNGTIAPSSTGGVSETLGTDWVTRTSGGSRTNIGGSYWVKVTQTAEDLGGGYYVGPALGQWVNLESSESIAINQPDVGTITASYLVSLATDQWGTNVVSSQTISLSATGTFTVEDPPAGPPL